ncbi:MAG: transcription-repair coupling factor [Spirochaetales bacterium]|nr:transcription-repair coupling factor [Spirochaetales bacterium]
MSDNITENVLVPLLSSWKSFHDCVNSCADGNSIFPADVTGLKGALTDFFIAEFYRRSRLNLIHKEHSLGKTYQHQNDFIIVTPTQKESNEVDTDLQAIFGDKAEVLKLSWWEMLPYRKAAVGSAVFGERAGVLAKLANKNLKADKPRFFVINQRSLLTPVPPPEYIRKLSFRLSKGQSFAIEDLVEKLTLSGYIRVSRVSVKGEFALRGEVLDVFLCSENFPFRIVFDFETIENIKIFDTDSQSTKKSVDSIIIYPMKEVVWNDELVEKLEHILEQEDKEGILNDFASYDALRKTNDRSYTENNQAENENNQTFVSSPDETNEGKPESVHLALSEKGREKKETLLTELSVKKQSEGEELFYGILWDRQYSVLDYISEDTAVFYLDYDRLVNGKKLLENEYALSYRTERQNFPVLMPKYMLFDFETLQKSHKSSIRFRSLETMELAEQGNALNIESEVSQSFFGNIAYLKEKVSSLQKEKWHIFVFADNENQSLRIKQILSDFIQVNDSELFPLEIIPEAISQGFSIAEEKILVIQENEIFGRKKTVPKSIRNTKSKVIDTFVELSPGDYVVHVNYGIGLFKGIERIKSMGTERDYIKLEYADEECAYVPIEQVNLVQRYIGNENEKPKVDRIGSKSWSARKARVQQKVEEVANQLIALYSKRQASRGFAFPKDTEWNVAFEAAFPYEDTPDQLTATEEIKADMERPVPMDRLVCGDVGYGKTEIAMRAAFKAVMGGKQVAFLAPTTILAEQHYENCIERFKNFPVHIAQLSRFISPAEQKRTIAALGEGKIDILVGTHRILQRDVKYRDLGLLIIDEEQRFGVKDKERLKEIKHNIDCLAMSATPIPRTLNMSLLKIRDMSLLTTPPQNRQSIETVIESYNDEKIAQAVRKEVQRGGQVFYLHNRVETLEDTRRHLENIMPEMLVDIAHGQMSSEQLDDIFHRFKMGGFNILVATTIIENGIDIPNVNTIIIDRADMYGVSQLYQLRGRVGRSDRKAYAYLFYPENKVLTEVAMKRLQVISDFTELGSGFKIAMKDMEIRGAGNLLGKDQSGEVYAVGFEMYLQLLNAAIQKLSNENWHEKEDVLLELEYSGFIPDTYIKDAQTKMEMYKKIAAIQEQKELDSIYCELFDRFGPVPDEVNSLLSIAKIRIICNLLQINSLKEKKGIVTVEFGEVSKISIDKVLKLIKVNPGRVWLDPKMPGNILMKTESIELKAKSEFIKEKLESLV